MSHSDRTLDPRTSLNSLFNRAIFHSGCLLFSINRRVHLHKAIELTVGNLWSIFHLPGCGHCWQLLEGEEQQNGRRPTYKYMATAYFPNKIIWDSNQAFLFCLCDSSLLSSNSRWPRSLIVTKYSST